ncbi:MAG: D-glycero-beta-D-manno-heptose-7-phosphate kinase [bacterium]|nr:D-glycero-beta-D-manno-heptose-7-phosphate kinase [bacterium]
MLASLPGRRVLVVGDLMLDRYVWGRVERISPEAPVPVVEVERETTLAGGAANVARTIAALGGVPLLMGVVGTDEDAGELRAGLAADGIDHGHILAVRDRPTTLKTRVMADRQQVCRVDREVRAPVDEAVRANLVARGRELLAGADALLLSDYGKGLLSPALIRDLVTCAGGKPSAVDPKQDHFTAYAGVTVATPNNHEAGGAVGRRGRYEELDDVAARLFELTGLQNLLITCGERGMRLYEGPGAEAEVIETVAREVFDVTGAGDTVTGVLTLALAAGASLSEGAHLANLAAGVVIAKVGVATASPAEILRQHDLVAGV